MQIRKGGMVICYEYCNVYVMDWLWTGSGGLENLGQGKILGDVEIVLDDKGHRVSRHGYCMAHTGFGK